MEVRRKAQDLVGKLSSLDLDALMRCCQGEPDKGSQQYRLGEAGKS